MSKRFSFDTLTVMDYPTDAQEMDWLDEPTSSPTCSNWSTPSGRRGSNRQERERTPSASRLEWAHVARSIRETIPNKRMEEQNMATIFRRALNLYGDDRNIDAVWTYLNTLIMIGAIEEGAAEQIAYMIEKED